MLTVDDLRAAYDAHRRALYSYLRAFTADSARAEDLLHDVFAGCLAQVGRARVDDMAAYLFTLARRRGIDALRERGARERAQQAFDAQHAFVPDAADAAQQRERGAVVTAFIKQLSPEQQEVVYLKIYGDLTFDETGRALGIPAQTAATRYRSALARLQELMRSKQHGL